MNSKQTLFGKVKAGKGGADFSVIASTSTVDRQGESIDQAGWELGNYLNNPVILFAHDYSSLPIGIATSVEVTEQGLVMSGKFASAEANPVAQNVKLLYEEGILNTVSVGFIPKERNGNIITRAELLEVSFVPVPANPEALSLAMKKGLVIDKDLVEFINKCGQEAKEVEEEVNNGDAVLPNEEETSVEEAPAIVEEIAEVVDEITKSGRVLSNKNRTLIAETVTSMEVSLSALKDLLSATDTPPEKAVVEEEVKSGFVEIPVEIETLKELLTHTRIADKHNELANSVLKRLLKN